MRGRQYGQFYRAAAALAAGCRATVALSVGDADLSYLLPADILASGGKTHAADSHVGRLNNAILEFLRPVFVYRHEHHDCWRHVVATRAYRRGLDDCVFLQWARPCAVFLRGEVYPRLFTHGR